MSRGNAERLIFDSKMKADKDYWIQKLIGAPGEPNLRPDFERHAAGPGPLETVGIALADPVYQKLVKVTDGVDLLAYTLLMAALKVSLQKYSGGNSIAVGSLSIRQEGGDAVTPNALVIVDPVDNRVSFRNFLLQVQETLKESYARQDYPFERLVSDLGIEPAANRSPLFDVALALKNIHADMPEVGADMTITFDRSPEGITGEVKYRSNLFERVTIERFARHFLSVLSAALDNIDAPLAYLQALTLPERHELSVEWNDTRAEYSGDRCIHRIFEARAAKVPDAVAFTSDYEHVTYAELNRQANRLGHYLQSLGVGPEVVVGVCMERSLEMIVGLLGILKAGGAYMPLDPAHPRMRLKLMIEDAHAHVLITQGRLIETLPESAAHVVAVDTERDLIARQGEEDLLSSVGAENLAYVIYTSGSTGQPKGVLVSHWSVSCLVDAQIHAFDIGPNDRVLQFASLGFDASVSEIFTTLVAGATLELGNPEALYVGPFLNNVLKTRDITTVTLPPSIMAETLAEGMPALKTIVAAGESCAGGTAARWSQGRAFINAYGPTEVTVCASLMKCSTLEAGVPPIGRPIENKRVYLLDEAAGPVPIGVKGELCVGGPGLARGYLNLPDVTAEKFIPDPFGQEPGARQYRTGDLARHLPDGNISFIGRADHQVKIRGYRIELGEIENVLNQHPAIQEAVAVARDHDAGDKRIIAYVVPKEGADWAVGELRSYLKEMIPEYMVPSMFVPLAAMPLTPSGKVDRQKLPEPDQNRPELEDGYVAPRNELESELAGIFSRVLGTDNVGIYDNFFELGGHSLLAVQLISQVRDLFQVELDVIAAFEAPTVVELAVTIVQAQAEQLGGEGMSEMLTDIEQLSDNEAESKRTHGAASDELSGASGL
jgi:amino acid adenylation domain-containing protein